MKLVPKRLADHVPIPWSDKQSDQIWARLNAPTTVSATRHTRSARRTLLATIACAAAALAILFVYQSQKKPRVALPSSTSSNGSTRESVVPAPPAPSALVGQLIASDNKVYPVVLMDGSVVQLAPHAQLQVLRSDGETIRLRLSKGSIECEVTHRNVRNFVIEADKTEIAVRGTRFRVSLTPTLHTEPVVSVLVHDGSVAVRAVGKAETLLSRGSSWESATTETSLSSATTTLLPTATLSQAVPSPHGQAHRESPQDRARHLFQQADGARLEGNHPMAARALARLVREFPHDPRAGLAAYQLGRIRLLSLGQPQAAIQAFNFAIEHAPDPAFRQDAEAARIEAAELTGDHDRCILWRDAFLASHPTAPGATRTRSRCSP